MKYITVFIKSHLKTEQVIQSVSISQMHIHTQTHTQKVTILTLAGSGGQLFSIH